MFFFDTCNAVTSRGDRKPKYWRLAKAPPFWIEFDAVTSQRQTQSASDYVMLRWSSHRGRRKVRSIMVRALTFTLICASLGHFTTGKPGWDMRARSITMRALTLTPAFSGGPYLQKIPLSVIQIYPQRFAYFIKLWSNCFKLPCWPTFVA